MDVVTELSESRLTELLQAVATNDRSAFEAFYNATSKRVLSLVLRITQKMEVAEEVVGDVYLQVWRQADRFDAARGNALAWLTMIGRSRALDTLRRNSSAPTYAATAFSEMPEVLTLEGPPDMLSIAEQKSELHAALAALKPDQRQLLALAYFRGYSHSELSQFTGMPLGTVKTQLRRTVGRLKELMIAAEKQDRVSA